MSNQGLSLIIGASGGIGAALLERLQAVSAPGTVIGLSRTSRPGLDLLEEGSMKQLNADHLARLFAVNAIGPALLMKYFLPLMPRRGRSIFATLSARVGSISDNRLGGWHGYRAAKAALNQLVRTAAIEQARRNPDSICIALHPGTVDTRLSAPFAKSGLELRSPHRAARALLTVMDGLGPPDSGGFRDQDGIAIAF